MTWNIRFQLEGEINAITRKITGLEDELDKVMEETRESLEKVEIASKVATDVRNEFAGAQNEIMT